MAALAEIADKGLANSDRSSVQFAANTKRGCGPLICPVVARVSTDSANQTSF